MFGPSKVAIFVHGCFWHRCTAHYVAPKSNADFWRRKVWSNVVRDADTLQRLEAEGWLSIVIWEHEDLVARATEIAELVRSRR